MRGKLATVIDRIEHGHHVFRAYFKHVNQDLTILIWISNNDAHRFWRPPFERFGSSSVRNRPPKNGAH